ncbi:stage II sporulation protein B [Paenibacillus shirakamiensis]|uniref:Stage II sporulation protein B n=1 Tax=Paenibacillus shirakamiensis TaxID=1265935 RepID=A0ABS4JFB5_9BACL|nr:SPOR domain-containing protein [Paenibacillus shirakamiensis]MBP2000405.1 stage II sporulation protein B [Paenibacillus shirakamiensis]
MNKARMTFRFDGRPPLNEQGSGSEQGSSPVQDTNTRNFFTKVEQLKKDEMELEPKEDESKWFEPYETWVDPFQQQSGIPFTSEQQYLSNETYSSEDQSLRNQANTDDYYYLTPNHPSRWKVAGSVTAAIITGTLFGFVVLSLFNKDLNLPIPKLLSSQSIKGDNKEAISVLGEQDNSDESILPVQAALPVQSYYFLQYGVFSSPEGVKQAEETLKLSGLASATDTLEKQRVYAGVSPEREQAKMLSTLLKANGVNLFVHEVSFPAVAEIPFKGQIGILDQYFEESADLVKLLSTTSASLLSDQSSTKLSANEVLNLQEKHRQWTENSAAVKKGLTTTSAKIAEQLEKTMNSAVESMGEFNKNGSKAHLWEIQSSMMEYILFEQKMLGAKSS